MHDHTIKEPTTRELRSFAITTGVVVAALFGLLLPWIWEFSYPRWPWIFCAAFAAWGILAPESVRRVFHGWMRVGLMISKVTTPLLLGAAFFLVLMPVGLLIRFFGHDPLRRRFDPTSDSYRIDRRGKPTSKLENPY
jgi:fatty acid desaturase